jgi:hypothetical protein
VHSLSIASAAEHNFLNFFDFMIRSKHPTGATLAELFTYVPSLTIVAFMEEIGFYLS